MDISYELTPAQQDIWFTEQLLGSEATIITGSILYPVSACAWSDEELEKAAQRLFLQNEALRMRVRQENGRPVQFVTDEIPSSVETVVFPDEKSFQLYARKESRAAFNTWGALCILRIVRMPEKVGFFLRIHHLIGDAWTGSLIGSQLNDLLNRSEQIRSFPFTDHLRKLQAKGNDRAQKDLAFFCAQYHENDTVILHAAHPTDDYTAERKTFRLNPDMTAAVAQLIEKSNTSLFAFFMTVFAIYLSRTEMNASHFYLGTTLLNRFGAAERNTVGMFVHTLPVSIRLTQEAGFGDNMSAVHDNVFQMMRHGHCSYTEILREIRKDTPEAEQLFDISINYQNAQIMGGETQPFETVWYPNGVQTEALQVSIENRDQSDTLAVHYDYRTACFDEKAIIQMHQALLQLIRGALDDSGIPICRMKLMDDNVFRMLMNQRSVKPWPFEPRNLGAWFQQTAHAYQDKIALETADGAFTYGQLDEWSSNAASQLIQQGVKPGTTIALSLARRYQLPVMILSAIKAGAPFVLIDPDYPQQRIDYMVENSNSEFMIRDDMALQLMQADAPDHFSPAGSLDDLCYAIYTSGSTGNPKGVLISQRNLVNNIFWRLRTYPEQNRRIICVTNVTADTFLEDFFYSLYSGNTLCLVEDRRNLASIRKAVEKHTNNDIMTTPTFFRAIIGEIPLTSFGSVTLVGENMEADLAQTILNSGCRLHNEYGPSECSICATHAVLESSDVHVGRPIDNAQVYILDRFLNPVPGGSPGELCISGALVGKGYLGLPEANQEKFIPDFQGRGPLYRTGDLAYWREDMNIALVGRIDNQIKLRGLRIELDEIEKQLNVLPGVSNAAVIVKTGNAGQKTLCAFYSGTPWREEELAQELRRRLPEHMVPQRLIWQEDMPMNANGKINRKTLLTMAGDLASSTEVYESPVIWQEQALCRMAGDLLQVPDWGLNYHFFRWGGDSLKAIEWVARAVREGIPLTLQMVFDHPTVKELMKAMASDGAVPVRYDMADFDEIHAMLSFAQSREGSPDMKDPGDVLLTGGTGFLGMHLADEYLKCCRGTLWCLVRGKDREEAAARFQEKLAFYHGDAWKSQVGKRIRICCGDASDVHFGLSQDDYQSLLGRIRLVIHAAGNVKHFGEYRDFYSANVQSTQQVISFCREADARMIHCSTTSVLGHSADGTCYGEDSFYTGQRLDNVYIHSKFEAERCVLAETAHGLKASVVRLGNLMNRFRDLRFQQNAQSNAFQQRIRSIALLGYFPETQLDVKIEMTPVDLAAQAMITIARGMDDACRVFHLYNPHTIPIRLLIGELNQSGCAVRAISPEAFSAKLMEAVGIADALVNDLDGKGQLSFPEESLSCEKTRAWLKARGFVWPEISQQYMHGLLAGILEGGQ